ncbi:MAG TPA: hypothetical protein VEL76_05865, partial [Gemmataceae bacterium]|nr:hypothetical protein [Gemmataceae bacterium]
MLNPHAPAAPAAVPNPAPAPVTANGVAAPAQPPAGQKQRASLVAWLALIVALASGVGTIFNAVTSRRNYDRVVGNIRAKLDLVESLPGPNDVPPALQKVSPITGMNELTLGQVEDFLRLNPRVVVKNVGDEPIDGLRVETKSVFSFIDMIGQPEARQKAPTPWVLDEVAREDYLLGEKLMPGKIATINITKGLLAQMVQLQARDREDRPHYARFQIRCMAKLVGATAYDGVADQKAMSVRVVWLPKGFQEPSCKKLLAEFRPTPY